MLAKIGSDIADNDNGQNFAKIVKYFGNMCQRPPIGGVFSRFFSPMFKFLSTSSRLLSLSSHPCSFGFDRAERYMELKEMHDAVRDFKKILEVDESLLTA